MSKIIEKIEECPVYDFFWWAWHDMKDFWYEIRRFIPKWLAYTKVLWKNYDYDFSSILEVERYQMLRVQKSIKKHYFYEDYERDVERIGLAIKLLDIAFNDVDSYSDKIGDTWVCKVKVNANNAKRFMNSSYPFFLELYSKKETKGLAEDELYTQKAWYLYNKLKYYFLQEWWW